MAIPKVFYTERGLRGEARKRWKVVHAFEFKGHAQRLAMDYVNKESYIQYHAPTGKWLVGVRDMPYKKFGSPYKPVMRRRK